MFIAGHFLQQFHRLARTITQNDRFLHGRGLPLCRRRAGELANLLNSNKCNLGIQLAGIVTPNDGECHLDAEGYYTKSTELDYPSIALLHQKIKEKKVLHSIENIKKGTNAATIKFR